MIESTFGAKTVVILDDGLQNPTLAKDLSIAVVDAERGFGNGDVIPAGPLRAPLGVQQKLIDAVLINGTGGRMSPFAVLAALPGFVGDVLTAHVEPIDATTYRGQRYVAYAGIANPQRFFSLLRRLGATVVDTIEFADHHAFAETDAARLIAIADQYGANLVTTAKDAARLMGATGVRSDLMRRTSVLDIALIFDGDSEARLSRLIAERITR
jgi:tetraacyldisaccharide 4'-kinase